MLGLKLHPFPFRAVARRGDSLLLDVALRNKVALLAETAEGAQLRAALSEALGGDWTFTGDCGSMVRADLSVHNA
jgi:hypothetical protein